MTRTMNPSWEIDPLFEVRDGGIIATGKRQSLRSLNRIALHDYASNVASNLAVLTVANRIEVYASWTILSVGRVRLPAVGARVKLHIYGERAEVRLYIGGALITTASQAVASDAWESTTATAVGTLTPDADGLVTLELQAQYTASGSTGLVHVLVEEVRIQLANVPDATTASDPGFIGVHDEAYATADDPVDAFQLQTLDENQRWIWRERGRKCLQLYPRAGAIPNRLSSYTWRLDGPYIIEAPIHAARLDVALSLEVGGSASSRVLEVLALSEYEQIEAVISARKVEVEEGSGIQHLTFRDLKVRPGQPVKVWVAFKSEVYSATYTTVDVYSSSSSQPHMLWCARNATLEATGGRPWGLCMVMKSEDLQTSRDPAIKNSLGYDVPEQICDLAVIPGIDTSTGGSTVAALQVVMSPSPSTGITRAPTLAAVSQWWTGTTTNVSYVPQGEVRQMTVGFLYGVFLDVGGEKPTARRKLARAGILPSSGMVRACGVRLATSTVHGTPAVILRHGGNERLRVNTTPSGNTVQYGGRYLYVSGAGAEDTLWPVALGDPNAGVTDGLIVRKLYGRFAFIACLGGGAPSNEEEGLIEAEFLSGGGAQVGTCRLRHWPTQGAQMSPTDSDSLIASQSTATDVATPTLATANAYTQESTWPSEGEFRRGVWDYSPVFEMNTPGSFPVAVNAAIRPKGGARYASYMQLIVAGLHVWWGPRS